MLLHRSRSTSLRSATSLLLILPALCACGQTITDEDCRRVGESLQRTWIEEVRKAAPPGGQAPTKASGVLLSEGERLGSDWLTECKRDLAGKRVSQMELECLLAARSLDQIHQCSRP
ncbi:hypothetical protein [Chondromyces crocatus]|uniref:Lipoprotein n=1 Tax=Chondromyces crocatus TaxID=52 RepID=A0A0K1EG22_CHOCO|nr:hypothetical protein [Chondromyces crocatus]AKT39816.1 uncharacterized protein CMC5_039670 [Chondromyces crocatus]